jgi:uncharacterized protein with PIN domain
MATPDEQDLCLKCEQLLQPYLDRDLTEAEMLIAERHLDDCGYCRKRYRFEEHLRRYVHEIRDEQMDPALKARLVALRTPLV